MRLAERMMAKLGIEQTSLERDQAHIEEIEARAERVRALNPEDLGLLVTPRRTYASASLDAGFVPTYPDLNW